MEPEFRTMTFIVSPAECPQQIEPKGTIVVLIVIAVLVAGGVSAGVSMMTVGP